MVLLAPVLVFGGCTSVAEVAGTATQQDLLQIRSDMTMLQLQAQRAKTDADALTSQVDRRLRDQAAENERQISVLSRRLEGLATTITGLSSRVDEMNGRLETLTRQVRGATSRPTPSAPTGASVAPQTSGPTSPGGPVAPLPSPAPAASAAPSVPGPMSSAPSATAPSVAVTPTPPSTTAPATSRPATGPLQPKDIYQAAYIDFSKGSYTLAVAGFREFLRRFPDHELADDAQYWIGESYFSLARGYGNNGQADKATQSLEQAVQEFKKVIANYPRGDKTPTALYKEALALIELKQTAVALSRLQYLIENFPQAAETPLARERLASLKGR